MKNQPRIDAPRSGSRHVQLTSVPLPVKRRTPRVPAKGRGVVPLPTRLETPTEAQVGPGSGDLIFHGACDAPASTTTSSDGGAIISNVSLQLLFWGSAWNSNPLPPIGQVVNAVNSILQGPYLSGLGQYGVGGGSLQGAWIVTGVGSPPEPSSTVPLMNGSSLTPDHALPFESVPVRFA